MIAATFPAFVEVLFCSRHPVSPYVSSATACARAGGTTTKQTSRTT